MPYCFFACLLLSSLLGLGTLRGAEDFRSPPLPPPTGAIQRIADAAQLRAAIENVADDTTFLIADGEYQVDRLIYLRGKRNVTIRSESGDPTKCVLRGKGWDSRSNQDDILRIGDCENITVAGLTFTDCHAYGIKVQAEDSPKEIHILNCRFRDIGTRAIKGSGGRGSAQGGSIRFCHFENTKIPAADWQFEGNYISAIDMMGLDGWTISDNVFRNIRGRTGSARAAIFVWVRSKNLTVERNLIVNCDRGIALGNPSASTAQVAEDEFHVQNSICRNNFIVPGPDAGIELWWVDGIQIYNNTIWRPEGSGRGIRFGARSQRVHIANNLVRGAILNEGGPQHDIRIENNVTGKLDGYFVQPATGDLHLTSQSLEAIDRGISLPEVTHDFDGQERDARPDVGADEF